MASVASSISVPSPRTVAIATQSSSPHISVRHRFTVEQYHEMIAHGIFAEDEPIELIRGEIVRKMPIGNPRAATINRLNRLIPNRLSSDSMLSIQNPISTKDSEPEPDVAILSFCDDMYATRRPVAQDVRLLIEVADSSLSYDREVKGPVYAEAGIIEYWIINLNNSTIEVYRDPQTDGRFAVVMTARTGDALTPMSVPGLTLQVDEIIVRES